MHKYILLKFVTFVILCARLFSADTLFDHSYQKDFYNSIRVDFPQDPCDTTDLEVPDFSTPQSRISEVKCLEHIWRLRLGQGRDIRSIACNKIKYNVDPLLRGNETEYGEYPHMVAIGWKGRKESWVFKCGGSLISEQFVLTAAHCSKVTKSDTSVVDQYPKITRLGSKNIMDFDREEYNRPAHDVGIKHFITHPRYKSPRQYYDIALIELDAEVPFTWRIHPACLWTKFDDFYTGIVTGWGVVDLSTLRTSPILQKAEIDIIDQYKECDEKLKKKRNRKWQGFMRHQLCAGVMAGGIDTCQGDSGGPLQSLISLRYPIPVFRWNIHYIIGVTSFGFGCAQANTPSVYTRVASFIGWIENIVWKSNATERVRRNEDRFYFVN